MSPPPRVKNWLSEKDMTAWVREAPDKETYQRRLAISLLIGEHCSVTVAARMLHVGVRSIWRWLAQYNTEGPGAVVARPRGGRRDAYLSPEAEAALLLQCHERALRGEIMAAIDLRPTIEAAMGQPVSRSYLYDLLQRHGWRKVVPRPRHVEADPAAQEAYKKNFQP
jgi:transposase